MWLEASLRETVGLGPGRAWELVECHLTHHLAREAQRSHPSLQIVAEDAGSALALADQTAHRLLGQHSASEGAWRSSVAQVALACIAVRRAVRRLREGGRRQAQAQLAHSRAAMARADAEGAAEAEAAAAKVAARLRPQKAQSGLLGRGGEGTGGDDSETSGEASEEEKEEGKEEESDTEESDTEESGEEESGEEESGEEEEEESEESDGEKGRKDGAEEEVQPVRTLTRRRAIGAAVPGVLKPEAAASAVAELRERAALPIHLAAGYRMASQRVSVSSSSSAELETTLAELLAAGVPSLARVPPTVQSSAREAKYPRRAGSTAGQTQSRGIGDDIRAKEAMLAAFGPVARHVFAGDGRSPSVLLPPRATPGERELMVEHAVKGLRGSLSLEDASGGLQVARRLFDVQACRVCQRAAWREALRRAGPQQEGAPSVATIAAVLGEGINAVLSDMPALHRSLRRLAGCELPLPLRSIAWRSAILDQSELQRVAVALRAAGDSQAAPPLGRLIEQLLARGSGVPASEPLKVEAADGVRRRAAALLVRSSQCSGGVLPLAAGSLAMALVCGLARVEPAGETPAEVPVEEVAMLLELQRSCIPRAKDAARDPRHGLLGQLRRWPNTLRHLLDICARTAREVAPPWSVLHMLIDEEWLEHGLVGGMNWPVVLWVWDQCALMGWEALAGIAADCVWLLRRQIRRLDKAGGGAEDLRHLLATGLRDVTLPSLQAVHSATHRPSDVPGPSADQLPAERAARLRSAAIASAPRPKVAFRIPVAAT